MDVAAVLGTMTFGNQVDPDNAKRMVDCFFEADHKHIDTAYLYADGKSEEILGSILKTVDRSTYTLASKAHPSVEDGLTAHALQKQLDTSLKRLQTDHLDLFYLHEPDLKTPIRVTLEA